MFGSVFAVEGYISFSVEEVGVVVILQDEEFFGQVRQSSQRLLPLL